MRKKKENIKINKAVCIDKDNIVKIKSGQAELIASGTVVAFEGNSIEVDITVTGESLKIIFSFSEENKGMMPDMANIINAQTMCSQPSFSSPIIYHHSPPFSTIFTPLRDTCPVKYIYSRTSRNEPFDFTSYF